MFAELITWWKEQMRDLVPASFRISSRTWRRALIVVADKSGDSMVDLFLLGRGGETALGRHPLTGPALRDTIQRMPATRRLAAVLRIAPDLFLERDTVVPMVAERELNRVIGYEMDRLTPFQADEVFWTCLITKRDTERNRLHVRVTIVPKMRVRSILDALQRAGIVPAKLESDGTAERSYTIPLIEHRATQGWLGPRTNSYALGTCGVLAATAVALPFILQSITSARLDARIDAMKPQVAQAETLRKKLANSVTMSEATAAARGQVGAPLQYIAILTDVLPDDTYLSTISLRQRKLAISGRSAAAARLIGAMAANPVFRNPAFAAPVIRDETNGGEMFSIRADLGS
jgi:general secretion pathway protein L